MSIYDKVNTALLRYKPATNELVVLNESGFDNGPVENQVLPVTKLKLETSTSLGPQQMTGCCTSGTNLAVLLLKVGALGFATSTVLFHLHPMKKKFSISQRSDKDTSLLTKDQGYVDGNREEGPLEVYTSAPG